MSIWEMKDKELVCNMGILPSDLTKGRSRRISQSAHGQLRHGRDLVKAFVESKEGQMTPARCTHTQDFTHSQEYGGLKGSPQLWRGLEWQSETIPLFLKVHI